LKLRFTKRAVRQIEEIIAAIALESPQGARRVRERMQSSRLSSSSIRISDSRPTLRTSGACWSALIPTSSSIALLRTP
jgi:plasmid stabilization system protein ParE